MQDRYVLRVYQVLIYRHAKEVEAIQLKIQESEEKAKKDLEVQVRLIYPP
jgi:hypothetical protein